MWSNWAAVLDRLRDVRGKRVRNVVLRPGPQGGVWPFLSGPWRPPGSGRQTPGNPPPHLERHLQHTVRVHHDLMVTMMIYVLVLMNVSVGSWEVGGEKWRCLPISPMCS